MMMMEREREDRKHRPPVEDVELYVGPPILDLYDELKPKFKEIKGTKFMYLKNECNNAL